VLFSQVSLPDLARISRRTVFSALAIGAAGLVVCVVLGAALVGLGLCIGIGLGVANFRMVQGSVVKASDRPGPKRRPLALNTVSRLAIITAIALGLLFVSFDLGFGIMAGLATFQFLLLFSVVRSLLKSGARPGLGGGGLAGLFATDHLADLEPPATDRPPLEAQDERRGEG
jgi:hypothetical protein